MAPSTAPSFDDKVKDYIAAYKDFTDLVAKQPTPSQTTASDIDQSIKRLELNDKALEEEVRKDFLKYQNPKTSKMPVHPAEENAGGSITDKVAKESSDSNASTHQLHDSDSANKATSGGQVAAEAHKANPGPVHADNLPAAASKEELKKRAEELNK